MLNRIARSKAVLTAIGRLMALYLRTVRATSRIERHPADFDARIGADAPIICALWHGQHFMIPLVRPAAMRFAVLISKHGDGEINAAACENLGIRAVRGSGGRPEQMHKKGGVAGLRDLLRTLAGGESVTLTADVPKRARVAGLGIVTLARMSGRPVYPTAVVSSRVKIFDSWDKATIGLPFGRIVAMIGEPLHVPPDADEAAMEAFRLRLESELDRVHREAYARLGATDPGEGLGTAA